MYTEEDKMRFIEPRKYYDQAIIGHSTGCDGKSLVVYSKAKLIDQIMLMLREDSEDHSELEDAIDYYYFNIEPHHGEFITIVNDFGNETESLLLMSDSPLYADDKKKYEFDVDLHLNKTISLNITFSNLSIGFSSDEAKSLIIRSLMECMPNSVKLIYAMNESDLKIDFHRVDDINRFKYIFSMKLSGAMASISRDVSMGAMSFVLGSNKDALDLLPYDLKPRSFSFELLT